MAPLTIEGITVDFPYEPYPSQIDYMKNVIETLNRGWNCALESPTGTGKTLCLLCASLAWLQAHKVKVYKNASAVIEETSAEELMGLCIFPKILYTSRTHSQLTQVVKELNKTIYKNMKVCVLGSRDQLCLNEQVRSESNSIIKIHKCRYSVTKRICPYYLEFDRHKVYHQKAYECGKVLDIEDFIRIGRKTRICPYFKSRENYETADLVLLPYNYILDHKTRQAHKIELKGNVVIFDEAHNLQKICEEGSSVSLRSCDVSGCLREAKQALEAIIKEEEDYRKQMDESSANFGSKVENDVSLQKTVETNDLAHLIILFQNLETQIDSIDIKNSGSPVPNVPGKIFPPDYLYKLLSQAEILPHMREGIVSLIDKLTKYFTDKSESSGGILQNQGKTLQIFSDFISTVFSDAELSAVDKKVTERKGFLLYIMEDSADRDSNKTSMKTYLEQQKPGLALHYWCFSAGSGMELLASQQLRSILITSGTLSPLTQFVHEMKIPFQMTLENKHVIEKSQVWMGILNVGPDGTNLNSSYHNRENVVYLNSLGNALINLCRVVPQGVLVFFASYVQLNTCVNHWKESKVWSGLMQRKSVFVEPKSKLEFQDTMKRFDEAVTIEGSNGAVLMAVCRGKVSEGIDFSDKHGRAVVLVGIPYPPLKDTRVCLKKNYLLRLKQAKEENVLDPEKWYSLEAVRAVNQAIGRVIRHKQDFGAIILADNRFASWPISHFPSWLRDVSTVYKNFGDMQRQLGAFFRRCGLRNVEIMRSTSEGGKSAFGFTQANRIKRPLPLDDAQVTAKQALYNMFHSTQEPPSENQFQCDLTTKYQSEPVFTTSTQLPCCSSALETLERSEEKPTLKPIESNCQSSRCCVKMEPDSRSHRKRIKLKVNDSQKPAAKEDWREISPIDYVKMLKSVLAKEVYKEFHEVTAKYKKGHDYDLLLSDLTRILLPHNHRAFKGFYAFLLPRHKDQFERFCREKLRFGLGSDAK